MSAHDSGACGGRVTRNFRGTALPLSCPLHRGMRTRSDGLVKNKITPVGREQDSPAKLVIGLTITGWPVQRGGRYSAARIVSLTAAQEESDMNRGRDL